MIGIGGTLRRLTRSFVGPFAVRTVQGHFADRLFLSVKGVAANGMLTDADPLEAELKRTMIEQAGESVLLIDQSKLSVRGLSVIAPLSEVATTLATGLDDAEAPARAKSRRRWRRGWTTPRPTRCGWAARRFARWVAPSTGRVDLCANCLSSLGCCSSSRPRPPRRRRRPAARPTGSVSRRSGARLRAGSAWSRRSPSRWPSRGGRVRCLRCDHPRRTSRHRWTAAGDGDVVVAATRPTPQPDAIDDGGDVSRGRSR